MFVAGIPFVVASGVQVLIHETGDAGREWIFVFMASMGVALLRERNNVGLPAPLIASP